VNSTELPPDQQEAGPSAPAPSESVEHVRKIYVRDLREKERLHTVFKVTRKELVTARSGKSFLALTLVDRTGEVDARIFERVEERERTFKGDDYVLVQGQVISFHGKPQVVIEKLERLDPEPIDAREFQPPPAAPAPSASTPAAGDAGRGAAVVQIREIVERVQDPHVRALLLAFLDDPKTAEGLKVAPAAKGIHHAYKGGLAERLLSVMKLAHRMADHYPMVDRDLLIAGALLHDIGKVQELSYERGNFDYTDEGRLVGHLVMTAQKIHEHASRIEGFPPLLEQHITHLVLAHHGQLEFGSPKLPVTLEALIVHLIDTLDSRVASWLEAMARDSNERWTDVVRHYDRHLWKGPSPTVRNKSPIEGRRRHGKDKEKDKDKDRERKEARREKDAKPPQGHREKDKDKEKDKERERAKEAEPKVEKEPPKPLNFKPLSALTDLAPPPAAPAEPPAPTEGES
jgi:3'-5' exoribonuclease